MTGRIASVAAIVVALLTPAAPARAACASPTSLEAAIEASDIVFVGEVVDVSVDGVATVAVESIWKGEPLPAEVHVDGAPPATSTFEHRGFDEGVRYLFLPKDSEPPFQDDRCTSTSIYKSKFDELKPAGAIERPEGIEPDRSLGWTIAVAALLLALLVLQYLRTGRKARGTRWEHQVDESRSR